MTDTQKYYISWSGGKDSTATVILAHENNFPIDRIVISLPFFDKSRGIYADHPLHIDWVFKKAIPMFEEWGYNVDVVSSEKDYLYWFHHRRGDNCKNSEYNGKRYGWLIGGLCKMNGEKTKPMKKYIKSLGEGFVGICGIGLEEINRLERMRNRGQISLLERYGYTTEMAKEICEKYELLSPFYSLGFSRQGCWFCPNASVKELAQIKSEYPHLWEELVVLSKYEDTATKNFKRSMSFEQISVAVDNVLKDEKYKMKI